MFFTWTTLTFFCNRVAMFYSCHFNIRIHSYFSAINVRRGFFGRMTTGLASYRRNRVKSKSNNDICSIGMSLEAPEKEKRSTRHISSEDLATLAEIVHQPNMPANSANEDMESAEQNLTGLRKEFNNRRNIVR